MAFNKLKGFFKQNIQNNNNTPTSQQPITQPNDDVIYGKSDEETYEDWGFKMARKQHGNQNSYKGCWNLVKDYYRKKQSNNIQQQQQEIEKAQQEIDKIETQIQQKNNLITTFQEKIKAIKEKIDSLNRDIFKIQEDPTIVQKDKVSKVGFIIGLTILIGLTIYLFMFYSSASYSALFKNFTADDDNVAVAIFDAQAFSNALNDGFTELILILTIPFAFLGLGYLIHKFQEQEGIQKYLKIGFLIIITFIFDFILAFEITEKIYEIKRAGSFQEMPEYTVGLAFNNPSFWVIIFAGFVVYLIWGFVFDFTIEAYDKLDIVRKAIQAKQSEIKLLENDIIKEQNNIQENKNEIDKLELECIAFRNIVNGNTISVNWDKFFNCIGDFTNGWTHWMTANKINLDAINAIHTINENLQKDFKVSLNKNEPQTNN